MKNEYKPKTTRKLINQLNKHKSIKAILEMTQVSLKEILQNCALEVPEEYLPGVGWVLICDPKITGVKGENIDLLQTVLKFAWSYSDELKDEIVHSFVARELTMFEAGMELQKIYTQKKDASKKLRPRIPQVDAWLEKRLNQNSKLLGLELWNEIPERINEEDERDCEFGIYRDGETLLCIYLPDKSLSFRAFCLRVEKIRKKIGT